MSLAHPIITLTTDFGTQDHYVAQMKGVILQKNPTVTIVDVTHQIAPQDIRRAAFLLDDLGPSFPGGTVHVAVVDPGVGTSRAILAVSAGDQFYIAPDNGLLTLVLQRHPTAQIFAVATTSDPSTIAPTFHGRDIMAPAAAHLSLNESVEALGQKFDSPPKRLTFRTAQTAGNRLTGEIAWIDRFGNIVTTLTRRTVEALRSDRLRISISGIEITGLSSFYGEVSPGEPLALIGSSGYLEIAVNGGSAAEQFQVIVGETVTVQNVDASVHFGDEGARQF